MTTETQPELSFTPFLLRFSERLPLQELVRMKYDSTRQVSLVEADGRWVDATDSSVVALGTYSTEVRRETTDEN